VAVYMDVTELKLAEDRANAEWLRVQKELQSAHELQLALLPRQFPLPTPERPLTFAAKWTPSGEVTGDFYDVFEVGEHRIGIVIGDATGHDVGAALFMARAFTILKTTISRDRGPGSVLMQLNNELVPGNESFMFATVFYGVFDIKTGVLTYANAGHLPPYLFGSDRNLEQLSAPGALPVGVRLDTSYVEKSVNLVPGDALFCYSDGITEAKNPSHKEFSDTNLATVLKECVQFPAEDVINHVFDKVSEFTDHAPPFDDMTCVAMRYLRDGENPNTKVQRPN
jgi:sigma-B regulation protein RsbU (phosphoserine phosphatase)